MEAFLLETLTSTGWRRGGDLFWTLDDAEVASRRMIRRKLVRRVRVLPVEIGPEAVADVQSAKQPGQSDQAAQVPEGVGR